MHCELTESALCAALPALKSPIDQAKAANIPWKTILTWIKTYGPDLATKIGELIDLFTKTPPTPTPSNP